VPGMAAAGDDNGSGELPAVIAQDAGMALNGRPECGADDGSPFLPKEHCGDIVTEIELTRSTGGEKGQQIDNVQRFQQLRDDLGPAHPERSAESAKSKDGHGLASLQATARERRNVFASLMEAMKTHSLGQISHALYDVGCEYRRNM
jgi:methylmalonyl-CoA mutase